MKDLIGVTLGLLVFIVAIVIILVGGIAVKLIDGSSKHDN